jgi:cysteine desulfurase family protein (TIGR01976 family)
MPNTLDIPAIRAQFPALSAVTVSGRSAIFLDGPGGTQVPRAVIEAMANYLTHTNANHEGAFLTSEQSDAMLVEAHVAAADFFNAASPEEVVFGANMTTLTLHISRSIACEIGPGDEVIVTRLDHDADIWPWVLMAEDRGATVRWVDFDVEECTLDMAMLRDLLGERTKLVAVGYASNATGTINNIPAITAWAHDVGAMVYVDSVHYGPHGPIDVQALDCDFLVCSAYKFFGPHAGILYGKREHLERLKAYKVRPAPDAPPGKFETGTQNHEGVAGTLAAINYLADLGERYGAAHESRYPGLTGRRLHLKTALTATQTYEHALSEAILAELATIPEIHVHGITDLAQLDERVPTVSFTWPGRHPKAIAAALGEQGIFVWDGNYYALAVTERLGVEEGGGMVRVGAVHYNTLEEIARLGAALRGMAG